MLTVMVFALGSVSGAHFNPAVSLAITLRGKMPVDLMFAYMAAQILGGFLQRLPTRPSPAALSSSPHCGTTPP